MFPVAHSLAGHALPELGGHEVVGGGEILARHRGLDELACDDAGLRVDLRGLLRLEDVRGLVRERLGRIAGVPEEHERERGDTDGEHDERSHQHPTLIAR